MTRSYKLLTLIAALLLLAACQPAAPVATVQPTEEVIETATPVTPTETPTPEPSVTQAPTETPIPTEDPIKVKADLVENAMAEGSTSEDIGPTDIAVSLLSESFWSGDSSLAEIEAILAMLAEDGAIDESIAPAIMSEINPSGFEVGEWDSMDDMTPEDLAEALECEDFRIGQLGITQGVRVMVETKDGVHLIEVVTNFSEDVLKFVSANPEDFTLALDNLLETKGDIPGDELGQPIKIFMLNDDLTSGKEVFEALGLHSAVALEFEGFDFESKPRQEFFDGNSSRQIYVITINESFLRSLVATSRGNDAWAEGPLETVIFTPIMMQSFAKNQGLNPVQVESMLRSQSMDPMIAIDREWADSPGWRGYDDPWLGIDFEIKVN